MGGVRFGEGREGGVREGGEREGGGTACRVREKRLSRRILHFSVRGRASHRLRCPGVFWADFTGGGDREVRLDF